MKVVIITEGGLSIGLGHITRCLSFYQAFEENGIVPELIINSNNSIGDLLKGKRYKIFNWLKETKKLFDLTKNVSIVIVDSYLTSAKFYEDISKLVKTLVFIDDNKRIEYKSGIVVNGAIYAEKIKYPKKDGVTYLLGNKYTPLRKEFWDASEKKIREKIESIMITFGGEDSENMTIKILKLLNKNYPKIVKNVVIGKSFKNVEKIERVRDKTTELLYHPGAEKMKKVMLKSDIAISAGGQTLYELARIGVPTIGICMAENQLGNLKGCEKAGFLEYIGWYNKANLIGKLNDSIQYLESMKIRRTKSKIAKKCVDGKGAKRIIKEILKEI
ncbi:MAG: UDP-2,4-diacetamido-2,4,6-trideoxy-beta-L-altropyranose hydrolase [bacterium]|nr:UDP-2,4-diacetamido-2,4,6-trideoxy-beta-L-altropyranose hydrolase [bacterium]